MVQSKEERAAKHKIWRANNKLKTAEYQKEYRAKNKEYRATYAREYYNTPKGKKNSRIKSWEYTGVKGDLSKFYDERYLPSTNCEVCEKVFKSTKDKCMDHSHTTGEIRYVLCHRCNSNDNWIKVLANKNK